LVGEGANTAELNEAAVKGSALYVNGAAALVGNLTGITM
jgi:hypothetical protein